MKTDMVVFLVVFLTLASLYEVSASPALSDRADGQGDHGYGYDLFGDSCEGPCEETRRNRELTWFCLRPYIHHYHGEINQYKKCSPEGKTSSGKDCIDDCAKKEGKNYYTCTGKFWGTTAEEVCSPTTLWASCCGGADKQQRSPVALQREHKQPKILSFISI